MKKKNLFEKRTFVQGVTKNAERKERKRKTINSKRKEKRGTRRDQRKKEKVK